MSTTKRSRNGLTKSKTKQGLRYKTPGTIVKAVWGDAHVRAGWGMNRHEPEMVESLGYVVQHDKAGLSFAKGRSPNGDGTYSMLSVEFVPNGMIKEVVEL